MRFDQSLANFLQSRYGSEKSIKIRQNFFNQSPVEIFHTRFDENFKQGPVENKNQRLIVPKTIFKRDRDRDEKILSGGRGARMKFFKQGVIEKPLRVHVRK